jgi:hypothetical protein
MWNKINNDFVEEFTDDKPHEMPMIQEHEQLSMLGDHIPMSTCESIYIIKSVQATEQSECKLAECIRTYSKRHE